MIGYIMILAQRVESVDQALNEGRMPVLITDEPIFLRRKRKNRRERKLYESAVEKNSVFNII